MRLGIKQSSLKIERRFVKFEALLLALVIALTLATSRTQADTGACSGQTITLPFTDVMGNGLFCSIAQLYFQGITLGVTPTTYDPAGTVRRDQMAAFLSRTQNSTLNRGSRRAALNQFWTTTPQYNVLLGPRYLGISFVGATPYAAASDGTDIWVANQGDGTVSRVLANSGLGFGSISGATAASGVLLAMGRVFVTGATSPGRLYMIDQNTMLSTVANTLGNSPLGIAFDGAQIWTANNGGNSISIITPSSPSFIVSNRAGFNAPAGILYDGANIWVANSGSGTLVKLDATGAIITTVNVGNAPQFPIFDGTNIWVPNQASNSVSVVRPSDGTVLATLSNNGLNGPTSAAFDGQRILVTNSVGNSVSLFRATDFAPLGTYSTGAGSTPFGVCSDGINFWITLQGLGRLARF